MNETFGGIVQETVSTSIPWWPAAKPNADGDAPNILIIILDDTGWSDFGCFGSEIATPAIDRLAARGLQYTEFHVTPLCSPTRACLLTGRNHHAVGMRFLSDVDTGFPNSRGAVATNVDTLPRLLSDLGYACYLVGKWHLTPRHEITPAGPFTHWPLSRGFHKFYGFLDGCTDQYCPELYQDNQPITPRRDANYHLSQDLADHAISYITDHITYRERTPFFLQLAFGAQHAPIQVPAPYIERYLDVFRVGWDQIRQNRLTRQKEWGLVPPETELAARNPGVPAWDSLSEDERTLAVHLQAAYAGFLEHTDAQIGRVLDTLDRLHLTDNTVIMLFSDNGASREGGQQGTVNVNSVYSGIVRNIQDELADLPQLAGPAGPSHYPEGWAMASNTPFRRYKQFVDLGGVRSPLIVSWPRGIPQSGQSRAQFAHVIDLAPTLLEIAQGKEPDADRFDGKSLKRTFASPQAPSPRDLQYFETLGHRAIRYQKWRAVTEHQTGRDYADDVWRLYDVSKDFSECRDLAAHYPQLLQQLQELWWQEARRFQVLPLDDRPLAALLEFRSPQGLLTRDRLTFYPGQSHIPFATGLTGIDRSMRVTAHLHWSGSVSAGVIVASGTTEGGYWLGIEQGRVVFKYRMLAAQLTLQARTALSLQDHDVGWAVRRQPDGTAQIQLHCDGELMDQGWVALTARHLSFWGLDIGTSGTNWEAEPLPAGTVVSVTYEFFDPVSCHAMAQSMLNRQ
ncbi:MAG: arylsulfatase [Sulfobacillus acidophilus]|uniref:Arylsulfatase n=1 Tax=Sulfobacillus acidophilus TaxID=53633 RepID=A0A2T2WJU5_9FIRM|nr:MAG: arylsulfatase [Sulfobacillus acidophilus]